MIIYTNHTRHSAIVTLKIDATDKANEAIEIGEPEAYKKHPGDVGVHDYIVDGGKILRTANQTTANFVSVRSAG